MAEKTGVKTGKKGRSEFEFDTESEDETSERPARSSLPPAPLPSAAARNKSTRERREVQALLESNELDAVTLKEASLMGGYSVDHLQREVSHGRIPNVGRRGRPRIRRCDVPKRPGHTLPENQPGGQFASRRRMALAVTTSAPEGA